MVFKPRQYSKTQTTVIKPVFENTVFRCTFNVYGNLEQYQHKSYDFGKSVKTLTFSLFSHLSATTLSDSIIRGITFKIREPGHCCGHKPLQTIFGKLCRFKSAKSFIFEIKNRKFYLKQPYLPFFQVYIVKLSNPCLLKETTTSIIDVHSNCQAHIFFHIVCFLACQGN